MVQQVFTNYRCARSVEVHRGNITWIIGDEEISVNGWEHTQQYRTGYSLVVIIYTTVLVNKKQASYFSCVVFLSIAVNHIGDMHPYLFVWNRFLDTAIGILVGVGVNLLINIKGREQYD